MSLEFEQVYKEHFLSVYKYVLSLSRSKNVAEEITQEAFFKAMKNIDKFKGTCKIYVWICQIAKNTYFTMLEKEKKQPKNEIADLQDSSSDVEKDFLNKDTARLLHIKLHGLKEPYKEVFTLRVFGELPFSQISELFGKTDSWARLIFYRAKKQLQEGMK